MFIHSFTPLSTTNGPEDKKSVTMNKALRSRDDIDKLYESRKEGRRGLTNIENRMDASIRRLRFKKRKKKLITEANNKIRTNRTTAKTEIGGKSTIWIFQATNC